MKGSILITGGAGYIGSHVVLNLRDAGWRCVVIDDLSTGHRDLVPNDVSLVIGDIGDKEVVRATCREHEVGAVMHFAGSIIVSESVELPLLYYRNNTCNSQTLLEVMVEEGIRNLVFSSTAAVYGEPSVVPVSEDAITAPINPYGASKLAVEWMLRDVAAAHGLNFVALRYFNVAGADPQGRSGQRSKVSTHLVKIACEKALERRDSMFVFGDDYDTPDGTCIRDYIHVSDLADAHRLALEYLFENGGSAFLNCGYGCGVSVLEVLSEMEKVLGAPLDYTMADRRAGDPPSLVADSSRLRKLLGWEPRYDDLGTLLRTALEAEKKLI